MVKAANSVNISDAGLVNFDGTKVFSGVTTTQYNTLVGDAANSITNIATGTTGQALVSAGAAANPAYGTLPVAGGGTGATTLTGLVLGNGSSAMTTVTYTPITSWTPTMSIGGSAAGITYAIQSGYYQVVGTVVFFKGSLILSSKGANSGAALITGLPLTSVNDGLNAYNIMVTYNVSITAGYGEFVCGVGPNSTNIVPYELAAGTNITQLTNVNVQNTSQFFVTGVYFT